MLNSGGGPWNTSTCHLVDPEILAGQKRLAAAKRKGGQKALLAELEKIKSERESRGKDASLSDCPVVPRP